MGTPTIDRLVLEAALKRALSSRAFIDAVAQTVTDALAPEQNSVILPPACSSTLRHWFQPGDTYTTTDDGAGFSLYFMRRFHGPSAGYWVGAERRLDGEGHTWLRNLEHMVIDDFGNLVQGRLQ